MGPVPLIFFPFGLRCQDGVADGIAADSVPASHTFTTQEMGGAAFFSKECLWCGVEDLVVRQRDSLTVWEQDLL